MRLTIATALAEHGAMNTMGIGIKNSSTSSVDAPSRRGKWGTLLPAVWLVCIAMGVQAQPAWQKLKEWTLPYGIQSLDWHPNGRHVAVTYGGDLAQVWNVETGRGLQTITSARRGINQSGQEISFSPDGKYLVVQDAKRVKHGNDPYTRSSDDRLEKLATQDSGALQIARVLTWPSLKEITKLMWPDAMMHSASARGFCWSGGKSSLLAVHLNAAVALYRIPQGKLLNEISLLNPYPRRTDVVNAHWWRMACDPHKQRVAVQGALINDDDLQALDMPPERGPTPIAIVDLVARRLERTAGW